MIKNETQLSIEQAEAKLAAFLEEFNELRAKYPEIQFCGTDVYDQAEAYIMCGKCNIRTVTLG